MRRLISLLAVTLCGASSRYLYRGSQSLVQYLTKQDVEIVLAHYREDIEWSDTYAHLRTVYHKGGMNVEGFVPLPNVGRESHTYLHHVVTHYDTLADRTVFCQATEPSWGYKGHRAGGGHMSSGVVFEDYMLTTEPVKAFYTERMHAISMKHQMRTGYKYELSLPDGTTSCPEGQMDAVRAHRVDEWGAWSSLGWFDKYLEDKIKTQGGNYTLLQYWAEFLQRPMPPANIIHFAQGSILSASRESIRSHPKSYYEKLLSLVSNDTDPWAGYYNEWLWMYIFRAPNFNDWVCPLETFPTGPEGARRAEKQLDEDVWAAETVNTEDDSDDEYTLQKMHDDYYGPVDECRDGTCPKFTQWSACHCSDETDDPFTGVRTRDCAATGTTCSTLNEQENCHLNKPCCPGGPKSCFYGCQDDTWTDWSPCQNGVQQRFCEADPCCEAETRPCQAGCDEVVDCADKHYGCPEDNYGGWSKCTAQCGGGEQTALCLAPDSCCASTRPCNEQPCGNCSTCTSWTPWSSCSKTCGEGGQETRTCNQIRGCTESRPCSQALPPCGCPAYSNFTACSKPCGGGNRTKHCLTNGFPDVTETCNPQSCAPTAPTAPTPKAPTPASGPPTPTASSPPTPAAAPTPIPPCYVCPTFATACSGACSARVHACTTNPPQGASFCPGNASLVCNRTEDAAFAGKDFGGTAGWDSRCSLSCAKAGTNPVMVHRCGNSQCGTTVSAALYDPANASQSYCPQTKPTSVACPALPACTSVKDILRFAIDLAQADTAFKQKIKDAYAKALAASGVQPEDIELPVCTAGSVIASTTINVDPSKAGAISSSLSDPSFLSAALSDAGLPPASHVEGVPAPAPEKDGAPIGAIVGGAVGGVAALGLLGGGAYYYKKKKASKEAATVYPGADGTIDTADLTAAQPTASAPPVANGGSSGISDGGPPPAVTSVPDPPQGYQEEAAAAAKEGEVAV